MSTTKNTTTENPSIYVGTYAKYNNGSIEGKWLDLTEYSSKDEFYEACAELHSDEEDPEFMFQDYEYIPEAFISESHIHENFWAYMEAINNLSNDQQEAFKIFVNNESSIDLAEDFESIISNFEESYKGHFSNGLEDYAYDFVNDCYDLEKTMGNLASYFDYAAFARDLGYDGYWEQDGYVFGPY